MHLPKRIARLSVLLAVAISLSLPIQAKSSSVRIEGVAVEGQTVRVELVNSSTLTKATTLQVEVVLGDSKASASKIERVAGLASTTVTFTFAATVTDLIVVGIGEGLDPW
jgi:transcriptional regulator of nitric oxide reductase